MEKKEKLEKELTGVEKEIIQVGTQELPKLMEDNDIETFKVSGVGTVYQTTQVFVHVDKADRPKLYAWARENGHGDMIGDWIFPNTLKAFVKGQLQDQAENGANKGNLLPVFVKATQVPTAQIRRTT